MIEIVAATRQDEAGFGETALGHSQRRLGDPRIVARIAFANHRPLGEVYNEALDRGGEHDIVVFMHDDVWLDDYFFAERIASGLKQFDVIGVAGNTRRRPGLRLGTWPVCITHQSRGSFDSADWRAAGARYLRKWDEEPGSRPQPGAGLPSFSSSQPRITR